MYIVVSESSCLDVVSVMTKPCSPTDTLEHWDSHIYIIVEHYNKINTITEHVKQSP